MLGTKPMGMNKIDVIQPVPKEFANALAPHAPTADKTPLILPPYIWMGPARNGMARRPKQKSRSP